MQFNQIHAYQSYYYQLLKIARCLSEFSICNEFFLSLYFTFSVWGGERLHSQRTLRFRFRFRFFKHSKNFNFLSLYLSFRSEEESVYIYHALFVFCFAFTFFKHPKFTVNFQYLMNLHCWLFTTESYSYNSNVTTMQHHCFTVPAIFPENKPPIPSENLLTFTNPPHHPLTFTWTSYVYAPWSY